MPAGTVAVEGLRQLQRDLKKVDKALPREISQGFKELARTVLLPAIKLAASEKGLAPPGRSGRGQGRLIAGLRPFGRTADAGVRSTTVRKGYPYPGRYEFAGRGDDSVGPRAFMYPGLWRAAPALHDGAFHIVDETLRKAAL